MKLPSDLVLEMDLLTLQKIASNKSAYENWLSYKESELLDS